MLTTCGGYLHPGSSRDETLPFFIGGLTGSIRKPDDVITVRNACGALSVINHRVYHPTQATQDSLLAVLPQLIKLLKSDDTGEGARDSSPYFLQYFAIVARLCASAGVCYDTDQPVCGTYRYDFRTPRSHRIQRVSGAGRVWRGRRRCEPC